MPGPGPQERSPSPTKRHQAEATSGPSGQDERTMHLNFAAIAVAGIVVFVFAAGYYVALAEPRRRLSSAAAAHGKPLKTHRPPE